MATRTVIFTALPNGVASSGRPQLSVHIAPRLVPTGPGDGQLQDFAEWEVWPNQTLTPWQVQFGSGEIVPANVVTSPAANPARWSALFDPTSLVRGRPSAEDFTSRKVRSYPVGNVFGHLQTQYATMAATTGDQYPDRNQLGPFINPLRPELIVEMLQQIEKELVAPNFTIGPAPPNPTKDFAQLKRFHTPSALRKDPFDPADNATVPKFDFHQMLALAQDHPMLLRLLGLVVDLELTRFPRTGGLTTVRVFPTPSPAFPSGTTSSSPLTECTIATSPPAFRAEPSAGNLEVSDGYLRLEDPNVFGVIPVDQDGGGLKAMDVSSLIERSGQHSSIDTPTTFSLPVLRSRGIAVFQTGRALALHTDKFVRAKTIDADVATGSSPGQNITLFAEDVMQGVRFDAIDSGIGIWRSLSARTGQLNFLNGPAIETISADEGMTIVGATGAFDGSTDDLYVGETITSWNGWSLGAPRPAKVIDNDDALVDGSSVAHPNGFPLEISHQVAAGSLPRLRFGHTYQLRGRTVDLAGNSVSLSDPSVAHASPRVQFGRLDPVESPAILLRQGRGPGEAVDRAVLRSNYNVAPSPATTERHLLASKVSELTAEMHGMFDTPSPGSMVDVNAYNLIAGRESKQVTDLASSQPDPAGGGAFIFDVDHVRAPYLPDPVSTGALLRGVGGGTDEVALTWDGVWPDLGDVRVVMNEQPSPPAFPPFVYSAALQQLDLYVAKADTLTVRMSTLPDVAKIREFGLWPWISAAGLLTPQLRTDVEAGRNWMFTPFRTITFVHAVKQPLVPLTWQFLRASRAPGDTFAVLDGAGAFSRKSTARIDLDASWDEYIDAGPGAALPTRPDPDNPGLWLDRPVNQAIPISAPVPEPGPGGSPADIWHTTEVPAPGPRHEFHDTKHRNVNYPTRVYSRFDEYFRKDAGIDFGVNNPVLVDAAGIVKGSMRITKLVSGKTLSYTEGIDYSVDLVTGEVTRLVGSAMPDQVHASWVPDPNDRVGPPTVQPIDILSSVRPDAPKIVYVIPTFQSQDSRLLLQHRRERIGAGVRVYLERPWWVTGGGEMLAVVMAANPPLGPQAVLGPDAALVSTQWGVDPVHAGAITPESPAVTNFPLRVEDSNPRGVPEAPGVDLAVAGHAVGFDGVRDLWYCDIDIDTGSAYFPFVRLALARWQPDSLGTLDLSPVVLTDYVQLAADRVATVTPPLIVKRGAKPAYSVSLTGPGYGTTTTDSSGLRAQVTVQQQIVGMTGPLAWESVGRPVVLTRFTTSGPTVTFTGSVRLPIGVALAQLRLLFEEFEQIRVDADDPNLGTAPKFGNRVVYADIVTLG